MRRWIALAAALVALVALGWSADTHRRSVDLTAGSSLTLTEETEEVVDALDRSVRVTAVLSAGAGGRSEAAALLARYRKLDRRIEVRIVDPDRSPGEVTRLGIDPLFGGVAVESGGRIERGPLVTEQDVTAALARLQRPAGAVVCVATGHGEPSLDETSGEGLSLARRLLTDNGYELRAVDLLVEPEVPGDCEALVLVNPLAPLGAAEGAAGRWLEQDGRALIATDPASTVDLEPLLAPYGIGVERGIVFEGDEDRRLPGDPLTPVVTRHLTASPVARRLPPTVFPGTQALVVRGDHRPGLATTAIARSTELSYLERTPATPAFEEGEDLPGPIVIVAGADLSRNERGRVRRTRLLATADADFLTNAFINQGGNGRLLIQALDWLTLREDLVSISANLPSVRPLTLTPSRLQYMRLVTAGLVPALFLLAGAMLWAARRSR